MDNLLRPRITAGFVRSVVTEMNMTGYLNPVVDNILVRLVYSEKLFSRLRREVEHGVSDAGGDGDVSRYVIDLNLPGIFLLHNLITCLLGGHTKFSVYLDSAFSMTLQQLEEDRDKSIFRMFSYLKYENKILYDRIETISNNNSFGDFTESAENVKRFYGWTGVNPEQIDHDTLRIVFRFILGHEIGHYVRKENAKIRLNTEQYVKKLISVPIEEDSELFADVMGILHSLAIQNTLKHSVGPTICVLLFIARFMDSLALRANSMSARNVTLSGERCMFLSKSHKAESVDFSAQIIDAAISLEAITMPLLLVIDDLWSILSTVASRNRSEPSWYFATRDYFPIFRTEDQ